MPKNDDQSELRIGDKVCVFPGLRRHNTHVQIRPTEICEVVELPSGAQPGDAVAVRRLGGQVVWIDRDMIARVAATRRSSFVAEAPMRPLEPSPNLLSLMRKADFCRSLLIVLASGLLGAEAWAVAVIQPAGLLLLWDSRPGATPASLQKAARRVGQVVDVSAIEAGTHAGGVVGALVRPHGDDLDKFAAMLCRQYHAGHGGK